jgi:two-component system CheB/CheR fusion protein
MPRKKIPNDENPKKKVTRKKTTKQPTSKEVSSPNFLIVGMGASAGGLDAFKRFFEKLPPNTGMAFVIVQHLDPTHKSMLSELLRNYTKMKVLEVKDNTKVSSNTVYTIPPNKEMGILNGVLKLMDPSQARGHRKTIDYFMRSLASDQKERAVGIIFSGTGSEGANGLKAIKGEGGLAIVQDPESAKYDGMPRSAIASQAADFILTAEKMPEHLINYMKKRLIEPIATQLDMIPQQSILDKIFMLLRDRTGNNFSYYKLSTIKRRIDKRMAINQITKLDTYLKHLQKNPQEVDLLFKELLIGVTSFFRDKEAFEALQKHVVRQIIESKGLNDSIRIWVPGCSTGEEAYSIAIIFDEALRKQKKKISLQIFASDIDEEAIDVARGGIYPDSIAADLSIKHLQRYFTKENNICKVKKELRDKVIFAVQNLIGDPPFSKLDMISCRNLLIYLNTDAQKRVFPIFHYSLNPEGFLFLGTSETIGQFSDLFSATDRKHKIFIRKAGIVKQRPRLDFARTDLDHIISERSKSVILQKTPTLKLADLVEKLLLINYAPGCAVINDKNMAVYFYGNTGKYLQPTQGEATFNILDMARTGLKADLRTAINKARKSKKEEVRYNIQVKTNSSYEPITLRIKPINQLGLTENLMLVIFEDVMVADKKPKQIKSTISEDLPEIIELEHELASTKEYLRTTIEELEISNEELKSANEELQSANEELQSTNEELETSKEELQSVNEEMITVNTELQDKIFELAHAHDDMENLLASTEIGTIFLGNELEIRRFTPSITKVINLIQTDIGRPVSHLSSNLNFDNLTGAAQEVLDSLVAKRMVVQSKDNSWYHMQITPYRTTDNVIDGVVMTFVDISEEKRMEKELAKSNEHLNLAIEALPAVPFTCKANGMHSFDFIFIGKTALKVLGFSPDNFTASSDFWVKRIHRNDEKMVLGNLTKIEKSGFANFIYQWKCANGRYKKLRYIAKLVKTNSNKEDHIVGIWQDVTGVEEKK